MNYVCNFLSLYPLDLLCICYGFHFNFSMGFLVVQMSGLPFFGPSLRQFCFCLFCPILIHYFYFILYYIISMLPLDVHLFYHERQKVLGSRREGRQRSIGRSRGNGTIIRIYYIRKEYILNKRNNLCKIFDNSNVLWSIAHKSCHT